MEVASGGKDGSRGSILAFYITEKQGCVRNRGRIWGNRRKGSPNK